MRRMIRRIFCVVVMLLSGGAMLSAADTVIKGVVTDSAGKPVRGAMVSAAAGTKTVSRYSQKDGRYELTVAGGTYEVAAEAYGFGVKRITVDTAKPGATNFKLTAENMDVRRFTGAEEESALPDTPDMRYLKSRCLSCHSFPNIAHRRGQTAAEWAAFLPHMTHGTMDEPVENPTPTTLNALSTVLAKYFGPDSPDFGPDADRSVLMKEVKHTDISDEALRATIVQYDVPTKDSHTHSIEVDPKTNAAWFGEESYTANNIGRFDMATETFKEYPLLTPKVRPHTGAVASNGVFWEALSTNNDPAKLAYVDPETGEVKQYYWQGKKSRAHTLVLDKAGNIWFSDFYSGELWSFDVKAQQYTAHKYNVPPNAPAGTLVDWGKIPGAQVRATTAASAVDLEGAGGGGSYDVAVDNEGMVWFSELARATLVRMDPKTGETKEIHPPGAVSIRGIAMDPNDNLWFGDFHGHRFGKLNVKTGEAKFYKPPTPDAMPYGVSYNKIDGNIWYADFNGNNVTRFNPKTEQFTEYRIPQSPDHGYERFIQADAKGRVWFTEYFGDRIGFVDPSGQSTGGAQFVAAAH
jgi:streptogramin lyase